MSEIPGVMEFSTAMYKMICSIAAVPFGLAKDECTFLMTLI